MFKKRKRKARPRAPNLTAIADVDVGGGTEQTPVAADVGASTAGSGGRKRKRKGKGKDKDRGKGGKGKGKSQSRRSTISANPGVHAIGALAPVGGSAQAHTDRLLYSQEHLAQLAASTRTKPAAAPNAADTAGTDHSGQAGQDEGDEDDTGELGAQVYTAEQVEEARQARRRARMQADADATTAIGIQHGDFIPLNSAEPITSAASAATASAAHRPHSSTAAVLLDEEQYEQPFAFADPASNAARVAAASRPTKSTELDLDLESEAAILTKGTTRGADARALLAARPRIVDALVLDDPAEFVPPSLDDALAAMDRRAQGVRDKDTAAAQVHATAAEALTTVQTSLAVVLQDMNAMSAKLTLLQAFRSYVALLGDTLVAHVEQAKAALARKAQHDGARSQALHARAAVAFADRVFALTGTVPLDSLPFHIDRAHVLDEAVQTKRLLALASSPLAADPWTSDTDDGTDPDSSPASAAGAFADAEPSVGSAAAVLDEFAKWRRDAPQTYLDAFGGLALVVALGPYVQAELASWDPWSGASLDEQSWLDKVFEYGASAEAGPDDAVLARDLVARHVVPYLELVFQRSWHALFSSRSATTALQDAVALVAEFFADAEPDARAKALAPVYKALKAAITLIFQPWASHLVSPGPAWSHPAMQPLTAFYFQRALKTLRIVSSWTAFVPADTLHEPDLGLTASSLVELVFSSFINPRVLPFLAELAQHDPAFALARAREVVQVVPPDWHTDPAKAPQWAGLVSWARTLDPGLDPAAHASIVCIGTA